MLGWLAGNLISGFLLLDEWKSELSLVDDSFEFLFVNNINFVKILPQFLWCRVFTRESSYCFQRVLAIAILSVRPSVRLSVTRVDQSKFSPSAAWKTLVSGTVKLFHKFEGVTPNEGAKWEGVGKICDF